MLAGALLVAGTAGFNVLALAAGSLTATGGAISTERAQEAAGLMYRRTAILGLAGILIGLAANRMRGSDTRGCAGSTPWLAAPS